MSNGGTGGGTGGGIGGIIEGFAGGHGYTPQYYDYSKPLLSYGSKIGKAVLQRLLGALPGFYSGFERGTEQQRGFQGEQEGVLRNILAKRQASDPEALLKRTGEQLFSFIDPNVINPLARFDVNQDIVQRRARGLNPAALDSTAGRLRNSRIASGRYYDVARNVYGMLPQVYQQMREAGITDERLAAGVIPQIQQGYRALDYAPLEPLQATVDLATRAYGIPSAHGAASKANIWGFEPNRTWANNWGDAGRAAWNTAKDAAAIYSSLYGGGALGGAGGIGGIGGGGGGAGAAATAGAGGSAPYGSGYPYFQQPGYGGYGAPTV